MRPRSPAFKKLDRFSGGIPFLAGPLNKIVKVVNSIVDYLQNGAAGGSDSGQKVKARMHVVVPGIDPETGKKVEMVFLRTVETTGNAIVTSQEITSDDQV